MADWAKFLKESALFSLSVAALLATGIHMDIIAFPSFFKVFALLPFLVGALATVFEMTNSMPIVRTSLTMSPEAISLKAATGVVVLVVSVMAALSGIALAVGLRTGLQLPL